MSLGGRSKQGLMRWQQQVFLISKGPYQLRTKDVTAAVARVSFMSRWPKKLFTICFQPGAGVGVFLSAEQRGLNLAVGKKYFLLRRY